MAYKVSPIMKRLGYGKKDEYENPYDNGEVWDTSPDNSQVNKNIYGEETSSIMKRLGYADKKEIDPLQAERNEMTAYSNALNDLGVEPKKPSILNKIFNSTPTKVFLKGLEAVTAVPNAVSNFYTGAVGNLNKYGERADYEFFNTNAYKALEEKGYDVRFDSSTLGGAYIQDIIDKKTNKPIRGKDKTPELIKLEEEAQEEYKKATSNNMIGMKETGEAILDGAKSSFAGLKGIFTNEYDGVVDIAKVNERNRQSANAKNRGDAEKFGKPGELIAKAVTLGKISEENADTVGDIIGDIGVGMVTGKFTDIDGAGKMLKYLNKADDIKKIDKLADFDKAFEIAKKAMPLEDYRKLPANQNLTRLQAQLKWVDEVKNNAQEMSNAVKKNLGGMTDTQKKGWSVGLKEITPEMLDNLRDTNKLGAQLTKVGLSIYSPIGALSSTGVGKHLEKIPGVDKVVSEFQERFGAGNFNEQKINMIENPSQALNYANQVLQKGIDKRLQKVRTGELLKDIEGFIKKGDINPEKVTDAIDSKKQVEVTSKEKVDVISNEFKDEVVKTAIAKTDEMVESRKKEISRLKGEQEGLSNVVEKTPVKKEVKATIRRVKKETPITKVADEIAVTEEKPVIKETPVTKIVKENKEQPKTRKELLKERETYLDDVVKKEYKKPTIQDYIKDKNIDPKKTTATEINKGYYKYLDSHKSNFRSEKAQGLPFIPYDNQKILDETKPTPILDMIKKTRQNRNYKNFEVKTEKRDVKIKTEDARKGYDATLEEVYSDASKKTTDNGKKINKEEIHLNNQRDGYTKELEDIGVKLTDKQKETIKLMNKKELDEIGTLIKNKKKFQLGEKNFNDTNYGEASLTDAIETTIDLRISGRVTGEMKYNDTYQSSIDYKKEIKRQNEEIDAKNLENKNKYIEAKAKWIKDNEGKKKQSPKSKKEKLIPKIEEDETFTIAKSNQFNHLSVEKPKVNTKSNPEDVKAMVKTYTFYKNDFGKIDDAIKNLIEPHLENLSGAVKEVEVISKNTMGHVDNKIIPEMILPVRKFKKFITTVEKEIGIKYTDKQKAVIKYSLENGGYTKDGLREMMIAPLLRHNEKRLSMLTPTELNVLKDAISNRKFKPDPKKFISSDEKVNITLESEEIAKFNKENYEKFVNSDLLPDTGFDKGTFVPNGGKLESDLDNDVGKYMGTQAELDIYAPGVKGKPAVDFAINKMRNSNGKIDIDYLSNKLEIDDIEAYLTDYVLNIKNPKYAIITKKDLDYAINTKVSKKELALDNVDKKQKDVSIDLDSINKRNREEGIRTIFNTVLDSKERYRNEKINLQKEFLAKKDLEAKTAYIFGEIDPIGIPGIKKKVDTHYRSGISAKITETKKETPITKLQPKVETPVVKQDVLDEVAIGEVKKLEEVKKINIDMLKGSKVDLDRIIRLDDVDYIEQVQKAQESLVERNKNILEMNTKIEDIQKEINYIIRKKETSGVDAIFEGFMKKNPEEVEKIKSKIPMYKTIERNVKKIETLDTTKGLTKNELELHDRIVKDMKFVAVREGLSEEEGEFLSNYIVHKLNPKYLGDEDIIEKAKSIGLILDDDFIKEPFNVHKLTRKLKGTIKELNSTSIDKLGIELFEDNVYRLWYGRMAQSEKYVYKKNMFDNIMNTGLGYEYIKKEDFKPSELYADYKEYNIAMRKKMKDEGLILVNVDEADYSRTKPKKVVRKGVVEEKELNLEDFLSNQSENLVDGDEFNSNVVDELTNGAGVVEDIDLEAFSDKLNTGSYLVDKRAWKYYQKSLEEMTNTDKSALLNVYDKFNNSFKAQAVFSLRFLTNNGIGNSFSSYMTSGVNLLNPKKMSIARKIRGGEDFTIGKYNSTDIRKYLEAHGGLSTQTETEFGKEFNTKAFMQRDEEVLSQIDTAKTPLQKAVNVATTPFKGLKKVSNKMEEEAKIINFITHLENGYSKADALELTNKALFDYEDLTDFEVSTMKRIIPFYTFMRKNVPLQYELLGDKTAKYGRIEKAYRQASQKNETEQERLLRPEYMANNFALGGGKYLGLALPMFDLEKPLSPVKTFLGSASPLIKTPLEVGLNKQFNNGYDISRNDKASEKLKYSLESTNPLIAMANKLAGITSIDEEKKQKARNTAKSALGVGMIKDFDLEKAQKTSMDNYTKELQNQYYEYLDDNPLIKAKVEEERKNKNKKSYASPIMKALGY